MAKSKKRFSKPQTWLPLNYRTMCADPEGRFVRLSDYHELRMAYHGALVQLDRAAKMVAELKRAAEPDSATN